MIEFGMVRMPTSSNTQFASTSLQGLARYVLTRTAITDPHCQFKALYLYHVTSHEFFTGKADQLKLASECSEHALILNISIYNLGQ